MLYQVWMKSAVPRLRIEATRVSPSLADTAQVADIIPPFL